MSRLKSLYHFLSPKFQALFLEYKTEFRPRYANGKPHEQLYRIIDANRKAYETLLQSFLAYSPWLEQVKTADQGPSEAEPRWNNGYLPGLDMVALYCMIALNKPARYVEIGSGNSTMMASKSIRDGKLNTKIISIDPSPRASIDSLADEVVRQRLETLHDYSFIDRLEANDILFIDNSHRALPNSDVTVSFLELIPRLKPGVLLHLHDIYLPYDYPQFMCDRFYSEQYLLATLLLSAPEKYEVVLPAFFISEDKALKTILAPLWALDQLKTVEQHGGSFWLRVR